MLWSSGEESAPGRGPETAMSMLRYEIAVPVSQGAYSSTNSVEPTSPYSSPSQEHITLWVYQPLLFGM